MYIITLFPGITIAVAVKAVAAVVAATTVVTTAAMVAVTAADIVIKRGISE